MDKNKKKKLRDIRNALVMVCVMVAMLSTASYAWFSMSSSATVTGMQMTAASAGGGLMVANENEESAFKAAIAIEDEGKLKTLKPVTPVTPLNTAVSGELFQGPVYTGETVTGLAAIDNDDAIEGYVAKYEYFIKETTDISTGETGTVDVGLVIADVALATEAFGGEGDEPQGIDGAGAAEMDGSFVRHATPKFDSEKENLLINPSYAVRVGFVVKETDGTLITTDGMYIWEPNANGTNDGNDASLAASNIDDGLRTAEAGYLKLQSNKEGDIVKGGSGNTSSKIFTMDKGSVVKVEMYVWLQGSDEQCGDAIQTGGLEAQVQFAIVGDSTTTNP